MINAHGKLLLQELECMTSDSRRLTKPVNLCVSGDLQAIEMVSEPLFQGRDVHDADKESLISR